MTIWRYVRRASYVTTTTVVITMTVVVVKVILEAQEPGRQSIYHCKEHLALNVDDFCVYGEMHPGDPSGCLPEGGVYI